MPNAYNHDLLARALLDVVGMLTGPRQDEFLLREAGIALDRALFALLVRIGTGGALNVGVLAAQVGRDQSTVSRQAARLADLGLIRRRASRDDRRVREAVITAEGRRLTQAITAAHRRLLDRLLADWSAADVQALARLNRRFVDAMKAADA